MTCEHGLETRGPVCLEDEGTCPVTCEFDVVTGMGEVPASDGAHELESARLEAVAALVAEVRGLPAPPAPEARLFEDVGCTSFDMMVVYVRLEDLLGHPVDLAAVPQVRTVADLARLA